MDFEFHYTEEQERFRKEVRAFIEENAYREPQEIIDPMRVTPEMWNKGREIDRKLGAKGWLAPGYPKEYGGGGMDAEHRAVLSEEWARIRSERRWPILYGGMMFDASGLLVYGTEEQKRRFLPKLLRGEWWGYHCFTEPEAGSDEASMKSRAVCEGDVYVINGTKVFVGQSPMSRPDYLNWAAVTDSTAPRHRNISTFFIPGELRGITYTPLDLIAAEGPKWQVICEDVRCPANRLIGKENEGWLMMQQCLRPTHGCGTVSSGDRVATPIRKFIDYCQKTQRNGEPISKAPVIQDILVKLYIEDKVSQLWGLRNFAMAQGQIPRVPYVATQGSLHSKRLSPALGKALLDILGPHCLIDDPELRVLAGEVEHQVRNADLTHLAGTPEMHQILMARGLGLGRGVIATARR